jgi:hypothetical protein
MRALALAVALLSAPAVAQQVPESSLPPPPPAHGRLVLNGAVMGAGLGLAGAAVYNLTQASAAYGDYLVEPDASRAAALLTDEVRPRQVAGLAEAGLAVACLGAGALLWVTTEGLEGTPDDAQASRISLRAAPGLVGFEARF